MLNNYFYSFTEQETNREALTEINTRETNLLDKMELTVEQRTLIEEMLFDSQREFFKLGFKECFKWIKELNK